VKLDGLKSEGHDRRRFRALIAGIYSNYMHSETLPIHTTVTAAIWYSNLSTMMRHTRLESIVFGRTLFLEHMVERLEICDYLSD